MKYNGVDERIKGLKKKLNFLKSSKNYISGEGCWALGYIQSRLLLFEEIEKAWEKKGYSGSCNVLLNAMKSDFVKDMLECGLEEDSIFGVLTKVFQKYHEKAQNLSIGE